MLIGRYTVLTALTALVASAAAPAFATAALTCSIDDANISFEMLGNVGSGDIGFLQVTQAELKIKSSKIAKPGTVAEFKAENLVQNWIYGRELRLGFNFEEMLSDASVGLVIIGSRSRRTVYGGQYELLVSRGGKTERFNGRIRDCTGD